MKKQKKQRKASDFIRKAPAEVSQRDAEAARISLEERIRQRAFDIHLARGSIEGRDLDDWLQAEREITAEVDEASVASQDRNGSSASLPNTGRM